MESSKYVLTVIRNEEGFQVNETGEFPEFELMGVLSHLIHQHSIKLNKEMEEYERDKEQLRTNG